MIRVVSLVDGQLLAMEHPHGNFVVARWMFKYSPGQGFGFQPGHLLPHPPRGIGLG